MKALTIRDRRMRTEELIQGAAQGQLSVLTGHHNPVFVAVHDAGLLDRTHVSDGLIQQARRRAGEA